MRTQPRLTQEDKRCQQVMNPECPPCAVNKKYTDAICASFSFYRPSTKLREDNVFSRVCPCDHVMHWTSLYSPLQTSDMGPPSSPAFLDIRRGPQPHPQLGTSGGHHFGPAQTCSLEDQPCPPLLTSGGHQSTYGWQAGSTHPTGKLSCLRIILSEMKGPLASCSKSTTR